MITGMSEATPEQPVAPGIAAAMHNARNATDLTHRHRHRWSLPSERDEQTPESTSDER